MSEEILRRYARHIMVSEHLTPARGAKHGRINEYPALQLRGCIAKTVGVTKAYLEGVGFDVDRDEFETALCLTSVWFLYLVDTYIRGTASANLSEARVRVVLGVLQNEYLSQNPEVREIIHGEFDAVFLHVDDNGNKQVILESSKSMQFLRDTSFNCEALVQHVFAPLFPCAVREITDYMTALDG